MIWRFLPGQPRPDQPQDLAANAIRPQLAKAGEYSVLRVDAARQAIRAALTHTLPIIRYGVEVLHAAVTLQVDNETLAAARLLDRARRELELDALARRQVKARLDFLRTTCLADPGTAKLFTLLERSPRVGGPSDDATLDELIRTLHAWKPESQWVLLAQLLHEFLADLSEPQRAELLHIMQSAIRTLGNEQLADRIAVLTSDRNEGPALNGEHTEN
ncbi:hypothetical protein [Amycolatopsis pithecellobii]|uniref:hypothetical protein n=1 Tax=Amycolatopsis pithecellobii TaxID=664692 RepID=UPI001AA09798|nr:hypothetical protein [Amycolatopsis pithecellobii]